LIVNSDGVIIVFSSRGEVVHKCVPIHESRCKGKVICMPSG
jgi:hypothetical protein